MTVKSSNETPIKEGSCITRGDLIRSSVNIGSLGVEFSWNYPRQMHIGFCLMIEKMLSKIYEGNPEGYKAALARHLEFFNITDCLNPFVGGVVVSMEERVARGEIDGQAVTDVRTALMGPLSGIGDSIFLGTLRVLAVAVGTSLSLSGNILGPFVYLLIYNVPAFIVRVMGALKGYELGFSLLEAAQKSGLMQKVMRAAGIVGVMTIGCMVATMFYAQIPIVLGSGDGAQTVQQILDSIMPGVLGLGFTSLFIGLLKHKVSPNWIIVGTMLFSIFCSYFGLMASA